MHLCLRLSFGLLLLHSTCSKIHSLPEDTYAFPKYSVSFLNNLPVLNQTASKWLRDGLTGGELEFLDRHWQDTHHARHPRKEIGGADHVDTSEPFPNHRISDNYSLELMKMGPRDSYLCYIPSPLEPIPLPEEEEESDVTPAHSWSLLQSLSGTCLYHRQGWFTYSYCHNKEIRQFKELMQKVATNNYPGGYKPEEDDQYESYTLGRAPTVSDPGAELSVAEQNDRAANLQLASGTGSRYLVQRWGDGTVCDKTGQTREVEVQFHCSMAMSDTILFVKETKTCSYVLVVNTPRLCSEPGFKSRRDINEQAHINCREIVSGLPISQEDERILPDNVDHPLKAPRPKSALPPPSQQPSEVVDTPGNKFTDIVQALLSSGGQQVLVQGMGENGDFIIEVTEEDLMGATNANDNIEHTPIDDVTERISKILRAAGINVPPKGKHESIDRDKDSEEEDDDDDLDIPNHRREL